MDLDYNEDFKHVDDTLFTAPMSYVSW